ncbi:MAG: NUDIX hydrolase, partial [Actinomycetota bacterium]|nr:NUDIX hydrolase [Actinomycetota bacterium]
PIPGSIRLLGESATMEQPSVQEPRPAATVIAARPASTAAARAGVEVLVLQRSSGSRFLPGYVVFPGGAVDAGDTELAQRWFGDRAESTRACAVRELAEETGLALTGGGLVPADGVELGTIHAFPPSARALHQISHWIAPEEVPVRFDARFFAVAARSGVEPQPDGAEADRAWWVDPRALLRDFEAQRCDLYWPTLKTVEALAECASVEEVLALDLPQIEGDDGEHDPEAAQSPDAAGISE